MKKSIIILSLAMMICGFWGRDAIWKDGDHFLFSMFGYKKATIEDVKASEAGKWWGCPITVLTVK